MSDMTRRLRCTKCGHEWMALFVKWPTSRSFGDFRPDWCRCCGWDGEPIDHE